MDPYFQYMSEPIAVTQNGSAGSDRGPYAETTFHSGFIEPAIFQESHPVDGFFSPVHHTAPGEPTFEPYDMDIYDDHATIWAPCPDIPCQTTAAEATFGQTGEGYLSFLGDIQEKPNAIPVGYASGVNEGGSYHPAPRTQAVNYRSYALSNALLEIPAESTAVPPPTAPIVLTIPAASPEPASPPTSTPAPAQLSPTLQPLIEPINGPPLVFDCPLGCGVPLSVKLTGLSEHVRCEHKALYGKTAPQTGCPIAGCNITKGWEQYALHLFKHLKALRGDLVYCERCNTTMKRGTKPSHLKTTKHKEGAPRQNKAKNSGGASKSTGIPVRRKIAPKPSTSSRVWPA